MGTPSAPNVGLENKQTLKAFTQYLPQIIGITNSQATPTAQAQLAATQATQGGYNALNLQQAQQFGLPLAQVGQQITNSNALAGAQTNVNQLQGAGGQAAIAAQQLARQTNPEYYSALDPAVQRSNDLLGSINLKGLSGGEQSAVERSLNQSNYATGNLGLDNATTAVSNAMNFGNALQAKRNALGQAIGTSLNTANTAQNTGFSPVNIALGQPNASTMGNFGTGTFNQTNAGTQSGTTGANNQMASSLLGNMFGLVGSNNANQMQASVLGSGNNVAQSYAGSVANGISSYS